jgi:hypothetical protein
MQAPEFMLPAPTKETNYLLDGCTILAAEALDI